MPMIESPSLWVQTVLYCPTEEQINSLVQGIRAAARFARDRRAFRSIKLALGDSSQRRTIDEDLEHELATTLPGHGIDGFRYEFFEENRGSARGQNTLFELRDADTDFVFVMNPDVYLCPDVFCEIMVPFDTPNVGIVEARQLPLEHPKAFDSADGTTSWASGACMMVRSAVLQEVGGFDGDSFFLYCDDVDFSWRTRLAGFKIVHRPSARVFHDKRLEADGRISVSNAERYYAAEAALLMAWKYSRQDLVDTWSEELMASSAPDHVKAVEVFLERARNQDLPTPIDPDGIVAEFSGHYYGQHRYDVNV
jgi:GT2 family glycosyltransferase